MGEKDRQKEKALRVEVPFFFVWVARNQFSFIVLLCESTL